MRKRRRLADKLTIMFCAVLVSVSAFFYAPMDVEAQESLVLYDDSSVNVDELSSAQNLGSLELDNNSSLDTYGPYYTTDYLLSFPNCTLVDGLDSDVLYRIEFSLDIDISTYPYSPALRAPTVHYGDKVLWGEYDPNGELFVSSHSYNYSGVQFFYGSELVNNTFRFDVAVFNQHDKVIMPFSSTFKVDVISCEAVLNTDSDDYQNGYNAGYSAGEQVGYGNGYSQGFADGEASIDTNEIYNQGFNAGKDSVDTQSYYDAGYQAGYQVAYQEGYNSGYDEGYQSAMDRIDGWGADTTDYPLLLLDKPLMSRVFDVVVKSSIPTRYSDFGEWTTDLNFNPNHTYRFNVVLNPTEYKEGSADIYFLNEDIFYLNVGGIKYRISNFSTAYVNTFFVPGDRMSTAFGFSWEPLLAVLGDTFESGSAYCYYDLNYQIYDMGPSGDTQNHIANQTDSLTNGFNDSHGNSVNNDFSSGLNDFETAEDSLFATATTGLKDFSFFDIQSVPAMLTGMSFVGSVMTGWFNQAGGASGVGIVLSILFSIMLVAMVLGLYRWYQSKGGKD